MAYGVVRTDNIHGTDVRSGLVSIKYMGNDGQTATAIENGNVLKLGALKTGEREIFVGAKPAANDKMQDIVLVASPEVIYDERKKNLDQFINEAGKIARAYRLQNGDLFSVTKDCLAGNETPEVGDVVELKADTKLNVVDSATAGSTVVGKIIAVETAGLFTFYVIEVNIKDAAAAISIGALSDVDLTTAPTSGQVLGYNGTKWVAANDQT